MNARVTNVMDARVTNVMDARLKSYVTLCSLK